MARTHAELDEAASEAGHTWSDDGLTVAEKEAELGGGDGAREYKGEGSVEETIENADGLEPGAEGAVAPVQSTTDETPSAADETSAPGPYQGDDAPKSNDPPVRTDRPDVPIAQVLASGAGEHTPPDPDEYDAEGRPR